MSVPLGGARLVIPDREEEGTQESAFPAELPRTQVLELWTMVAIAFLVFFSNSMIAPLIPTLTREFGVQPYDLKWLIPGFSLLYGTATLVYGLLSDRIGRYPVLKVLLTCAAATTLSLSFARNAHQLLLLRFFLRWVPVELPRLP